MKKIKQGFFRFVVSSKKEFNETGEMVSLIIESKNRDLTNEQKFKIKEQIFDLFKICILSILFILPFGSAIVIGLVKLFQKFKINILPSSFKK